MGNVGSLFSCNDYKWHWATIKIRVNIISLSFVILLVSSVIVPIGVVLAVTTFVDSFDISGQETSPTGLAFNTDGTKMFVLGIVGIDVNEYACTTGFDVSTCSFTVKAGNPFSVAAQDTIPAGLAFNTDGTKMFVLGIVGIDVNEYACTTGFDVSTCSFTVKAGNPFSIAGQETSPRDLAFNTDGTKMFVLGPVGDDVNEYACTTGFDVSTCSFTVKAGNPFSVAAQESGPTGLAFNTDGTKMFVLGQTGDDVNEYACTTGFDVSTCSFTVKAGNPFSVAAQEANSHGLRFSTDGTKMFVLGVTGQDVNEYTLEVGFDLTASAPPSSGKVADGSARQGDFFPPTLGVNQNGKRVVDYGFSYNGNPIQVEYFYTPYPLITANVGEQQVAELVIFEERGTEHLSHVALAFGLREGQVLGDSKAIINWDRSFNGDETVSTTDPENAIDKESLKIQSSKTKCLESSQDEFCTKLVIFHMLRAPLDFDIVGVTIWDDKKNSWQNSFNHGVHVQGKSLNQPAQYTVLDKRDLITITEIGKNAAVDENGYLWTYDKSWQKEFMPKGKIDDGVTMHLFDRDHARFDTYKAGQELLAKNTIMEKYPNYYDVPFEEINSIKLSPYTNFKESARIDETTQKNIEREIIKAEQKYEYLYGSLDRMVE